MAYHVSKAQFGELVENALSELPPQFAGFIEEVPVEILDQPTPRQLQRARAGRNTLLLGLYVGRPRTVRSVEDSGQMPDVIYLFQQPLETIVSSQEELTRQIRTTLLHEIGHHFGLDEDDLERLGYR